MRGALGGSGRQDAGSAMDHVKKCRSTCDRCTALKVRCDKRKPSCERCESAREVCVYGPYRWKGKPTAKNASPRAQRQSIDARSSDRRQPPRRQSMQFTNSLMDGYPNSNDILSTLTGFPLTPDIEDVQNAFEGSSWSAALLSTTEDFNDLPDSNLYDNPQHVCDSIRHASVTAFPSPPLNTSPCARITLDSTPSTSRSISPGSSVSGHPHQCVWVAFAMLQDLYKASSALHKDGENSVLCSDKILKMNRAVLHKMDSLYSQECNACASDVSMVFLQATIASKVLSWYRAVFNGFHEGSPQARVGQWQQHQQRPMALEPLSFTPTRFGDFELDYVAERHMKAQFLLCELQSLKKAIGYLDGWSGGNAIEIEGLVRGAAQSVHRFLSLGLDDLITRIDQFCASKSSATRR